MQRAHHLEAREDAEHAVKLAAGRLRVEVGAHADRREIVAAAGTAGEHVPAIIHRHRAADGFAGLP